MNDGEIRDRFLRSGLRCTKQRMRLYKSLAACRNHPTPEELHRIALACDPGMSLSTVYNALEAFCTAGLCRRAPGVCGRARFDPNPDDHVHVVFDDGRVVDVPEELGRRLLEAIPAEAVARVEREMGVRVARIDVALEGGVGRSGNPQ